MVCDESFRAPKDKAAAKVEEVEDREPPELDEAPEVVGCPFLEGWRRSCSAFARAFSWVRTKLARF
jgi:hypothetical protein